MPLKRKPSKRKPRKKRQSTAKKALSKVTALSKFVMKTIEKKQIDYQQTVSLGSAGSATYPFLLVTQGTSDGNTYPSAARTGNKITLMSQKFDMNFIAASGDVFNQIRCIIVESVDGNQTLALSDILTYHNYSLHGDLVFVSPYTTKTATNKRYKIHYDKTFELNGDGTANKATKQLHMKVKWPKGKIINFDDNSSAPTDHKMHLLMISDSTVAPNPSVIYNCRSVFRDA